jgi:hypothetical protein
MDFQRQYTERMRQLNAEKGLELAGGYNVAAGEFGEKGLGTPEEFEALYGKQYKPAKDPAGIRMFKWLGQKFGLGGGAGGLPERPQVDEEKGATSFVPKRDGGMIRGYQDGGHVYDEKGWRTDDYGRMVHESNDYADYGPDADNATSRAAIRTERLGKSAMEQFGAAETASEYGAATRDLVRTPIQGAVDIGQGVIRDVAGPVIDFAGGFLGFEGGDDSSGIPAPTTPAADVTPEPDQSAPVDTKAATDATTPADTPSEAIASAATKQAEEETLRNLDYSNLAAQGVRPTDLPSMNTQDWSDFRRQSFVGMLQQGKSPREAYEEMDMEVIDTQMRGFTHELGKAFQYLQTGQGNAAQLAVTMAYQYFPNGANVEFATHQDPKTGQTVLVARGVNEETGEPSGTPQIITADRINQMIEQVGDPSSWRTWTKDGRDLQLEIAKLESSDEYRKGSLEVARSGAITDRMEAEAGAAGSGAMTPSQELARSQFYLDEFERQTLYKLDEEVIGQLASLASQIERAVNKTPAQLAEELSAAWAGKDDGPGGELGLAEYLKRIKGE